MSYDEVRKRVVVFGGLGFSNRRPGDFLNDTWAWDGQRWRDATPR
jgi:hypothetical protein